VKRSRRHAESLAKWVKWRDAITRAEERTERAAFTRELTRNFDLKPERSRIAARVAEHLRFRAERKAKRAARGRSVE
jgi:hypothetical protein